jgi:hypothetical protein
MSVRDGLKFQLERAQRTIARLDEHNRVLASELAAARDETAFLEGGVGLHFLEEMLSATAARRGDAAGDDNAS